MVVKGVLHSLLLQYRMYTKVRKQRPEVTALRLAKMDRLLLRFTVALDRTRSCFPGILPRNLTFRPSA